MNESVGKKIVEALKRQAEAEMPAMVSAPSLSRRKLEKEQEVVREQDIMQEDVVSKDSFADIFADDTTTVSSPIGNMKNPIEDSFEALGGFSEQPSLQSMNEPSAFEMPSNIVVLKKLISQLPSGVSRHTGAQIIKQTMEALGISMRSVLQDAQQVQENLKNSAKECQSYIQEYKKQIVTLEKQSQNYQKQYAALNDLIGLFIQANK